MSGEEDWHDHRDACEECDVDDEPLRAIKMKEGRRRMLCFSCFNEQLETGNVDPSDPRVDV